MDPAAVRLQKASVRACFFYALAAACGFFAAPSYAQAPLVRELSLTDPVFVQLSADVEDARTAQAARTIDPAAALASLTVYSYVPKADDTLLSVSARCSLPYDTIATVNRIPPGGVLSPGRTVLIPAAPGLFVPERPESDFERLTEGGRPEGEPSVPVALELGGRRVRFRYYPGALFTPTERAFFLNVAFRFPLPSARVTSSFGLRRNPFTGNLKLHEGIDLAAPEGTEVYATRDGVVSAVGKDAIYGIYVVVAHEGAWSSLYGHLSAAEADLRKEVRSGTIIGRVGSTGQSTGPHLHFELRRNGEARDPASLLPRGISR